MKKNIKNKKNSGQSFVEFALTLPLLLMLLSGLVEFGFILNYYLALVDATREVSRITSNWDHTDEIDGVTFYEAAIGNTISILEPQDENDTTRKIRIRENRVNCSAEAALKGVCDNEIIISVYSIDSSGATLVEQHYWDDADHRQASRITTEVINDRLSSLTDTPNAGAVVVEVFYNYEQVLGLPWLNMVADPFLIHAYTIMPLSSAEPEA